MLNYSFDSLNDKEFEELVNDLLTQKLGQRVVRYAPGRDLGIDGKLLFNDGVAIVQSKHYIKSGYSALLRSLKEEKKKIQKLKPNRYIVATSIDLTPLNVTTLVKELSPFLKEEDLYFKSTINDLLKTYPQVERQHYKLWLTSTNVLSHLINNSVYTLSNFTLNEAREKLKIYTKTASHSIAMEKLLNDNCIIITGEPGVGKTTLAQQVCNELVSEDYSFFDIDNDIEQAFQIFTENTKQIFYYDDFLGSNYLEAFENNKDSKIVKFIKAITSRDNNDKLFILTSRASVLSQGMMRSDKFTNANIESNKLLLNINGLTLFDKASILYNHLYHSSLDNKYKNKLYEDEFYLKIIRHKNFNPRLIEFITSNKRIVDIDSDKYIDHIKSSLDNPSDIWHYAFTEQLKELERVIVYFIAFSDKKFDAITIRPYVKEYFNHKKIPLDDEAVNKAMHTITGSFIIKEISRSGASLRLFNPSIKDYLIGRMVDDEEEQSKLIFTILNQPSTIEVNDPVSRFQRQVSHWLISSFREYELEKVHKLLVRCATNTINFGDGIDKELCSKLANRILNESNSDYFYYAELVVMSRYISNNQNYKLLNEIYGNIASRAFGNISSSSLIVLSSIITFYEKLKDELLHKAESYYDDNYLSEENSYNENKYEVQYSDIKIKYDNLLSLFNGKVFTYWENNYLNISRKSSASKRQLHSDELRGELEEILESYKILTVDEIEFFIDSLDLSSVDEDIFEQKFYNKNARSPKVSNELEKIRDLFSIT